MRVLTDWNYHLDVDGVIKGQGADPEKIRRRSPRLVQIAENALEEAEKIIRPVAMIETLDVVSLAHDTITLSDGHIIRGSFVPYHLLKAKVIAVIVCTISDQLGQRVSELGSSDICYALALDGAGTTAVENLASEVAKFIEDEAAAKGWSATIPLNPGMKGWDLVNGQQQIFSILSSADSAVKLNESYLMEPFKSLSLIVGMGPDVRTEGVPCDFCTLSDSCQFSKRRSADE